GVVVLDEPVDAAAYDDGVPAPLFVQTLPERRARLGDLRRVRLDLAELTDVIKQETLIQESVVEPICQGATDLVAAAPDQTCDGHHGHGTLHAHASLRASIAGLGAAGLYHGTWVPGGGFSVLGDRSRGSPKGYLTSTGPPRARTSA